MAALAHLATTLLVTIGGTEVIEAIEAIGVTEDVAGRPDAPIATRMPMLPVEATETENAKIDMEVLAVTAENENGTATEATGALEGNIAARMLPGRLVGTVTDTGTTAVVVVTGGIVVVEIAMRTFLRKTAVAVAPPLPRSESLRQI